MGVYIGVPLFREATILYREIQAGRVSAMALTHPEGGGESGLNSYHGHQAASRTLKRVGGCQTYGPPMWFSNLGSPACFPPKKLAVAR